MSNNTKTMEIELNDEIARGLDQMVFKTQTSGMKDVWDARMVVKDLLDRYMNERISDDDNNNE